MEFGNHIDGTTSGKSPSGSRVGVVADARHCGVSSMRAQAKNQIAQFLPDPRRRIPGGAIRNVGNICLRIRLRSHAHDVCSSLAEVSPCGNPPFPCVSKCGCSWQRPSHWPTANWIRFHVRFVKGSNGPSCIRLISCLCRSRQAQSEAKGGVSPCKTCVWRSYAPLFPDKTMSWQLGEGKKRWELLFHQPRGRIRIVSLVCLEMMSLALQHILSGWLLRPLSVSVNISVVGAVCFQSREAIFFAACV